MRVAGMNEVGGWRFGAERRNGWMDFTGTFGSGFGDGRAKGLCNAMRYDAVCFMRVEERLFRGPEIHMTSSLMHTDLIGDGDGA
jgi:hypothetical protein